MKSDDDADENTDARVSALQLLLCDTSDEEKRVLLQRAFPGELAELGLNLKVRHELIRSSISGLQEVVQNCDGQSPLGAAAQDQIRSIASQSANLLTAIFYLRKKP